MAHVLREQHGATDRHRWRDEEVAVNTFAVAYWRARGESERLRQLAERIGLLLSQLEDPTPPSAIPADYFDQHYPELAQNPPAFGYYHFSMVSATLPQPLSWSEALRTLITPNIVEACSAAGGGRMVSVGEPAGPSELVRILWLTLRANLPGSGNPLSIYGTSSYFPLARPPADNAHR
jgi:hypothetical protein